MDKGLIVHRSGGWAQSKSAWVWHAGQWIKLPSGHVGRCQVVDLGTAKVGYAHFLRYAYGQMRWYGYAESVNLEYIYQTWFCDDWAGRPHQKQVGSNYPFEYLIGPFSQD